MLYRIDKGCKIIVIHHIGRSTMNSTLVKAERPFTDSVTMARDGVLRNIQFNDKVTCVFPAKPSKKLKLLIILHWEAQLNCTSQTNPEFLLFKETNLCVNFKMSQAKFLARETSLALRRSDPLIIRM